MNLLILAIIIGTLAINLPYLIRTRRYSELILIIFFQSTSLVYVFDLIFKLNIPTLKQGIEAVFMPVTQLMNSFFS